MVCRRLSLRAGGRAGFMPGRRFRKRPGRRARWSRARTAVAAPTSAGKGFLAEVIAARHLLEGERVVWLVPTRALAEALTATLAATFSALNLKVICATRERPESDPPLAAGRFDLCVAVPEKAQAWLMARPHGLAGVGLVVADELAYCATATAAAGSTCC